MFSSANNASLLRRWVLPTPFYLLVKKNEGNDTALKPKGWLKKKQFLSQACKIGALNVWKLSLRCKNHAHHTFHKDILPFLTRPHHPQHASPAPGPAGTLRTGSCQPPPLTSGTKKSSRPTAQPDNNTAGPPLAWRPLRFLSPLCRDSPSTGGASREGAQLWRVYRWKPEPRGVRGG